MQTHALPSMEMLQNPPQNQTLTKTIGCPLHSSQTNKAKRETSHCNFQDLCLDDAIRPSPEKLASKIKGTQIPA